MERNNQDVVLIPFFAPYKITLLALIAAYCAGILPKKTHRSLLTTIVKYIEGPTLQNCDMKSMTVPTLNGILNHIKQACVDSDTKNGVKFAHDIEIRILHALWTLKSLDSLHSFITKAKSLLVDNLRQGRTLMEHVPNNSVPTYLLTKSSFLGNFVSGCISAFESMEFDRTVQLWESFVAFRATSKDLWVKKVKAKGIPPHDLFGSNDPDDNPEMIKQLFKHIPSLKTLEEKEKETLLLSQADLAKLIDYQVHILETYGTPTLPEFREILQKMTQAETGKLPAIHYIRYLEYLRDADYEGAFNSLHRYFDYMMSNKQTVFYHYALLSLASLHASFNCDGEAIRAIEESISVARENKDIECLNFLLTWLFNFLKDRPNLKHEFYVSNDQLLQFLKSRSGDSFLSLNSTAYQSDVTQLMLEGDSLAAILESLTKSLYISLNSANNINSFISYCALASAFWFRTGNHHLSNVYNDIALQTNNSVSQKVSIMIRRAHLEFSKGNVGNAFEILDEQYSLTTGDLHLEKELTSHKLLLLIEKDIRSSKYSSAEIYLNKLKSQKLGNIDIEGQLYYLLAKLNFEIGNAEAAFEIIADKLNNFAKETSNKYWFLRFSLLNSEMILESLSPARVTSTIIQNLEEASLSGFSLLVAESILLLTRVLLKLDQDNDAEDLLHEFLAKFPDDINLELKSFAYKHLAELLIKRIKNNSDLPEQERIELITRVIQSLEIAVDSFKKISNFKEIKHCLSLELDLGEFLNHQDITEHASNALEKIELMIEEQITSY